MESMKSGATWATVRNASRATAATASRTSRGIHQRKRRGACTGPVSGRLCGCGAGCGCHVSCLGCG